ncbi:hypothetical protein [Xanthocytophaga agilis]|uniref:SMP-30/Gluconolactonase/LRE-like region domain-containing protein n=1 Tax=Xanthocytophaga agilis TaxID=3048010 RepID=A0AAE3UH53_9BACT|nr:hypothetical protein [Xanthocytophaga agilis]MDJ1505678.1 hypothetical protein [Xanthocytophaga agilis]
MAITFSRKLLWTGFLLLLSIAGKILAQTGVKLSKPRVFVQLDSTCMTPDAMAFDESGNFYLSVTNATTYDRFGAKIIKLNPEGKILNTWTSLPKNPLTGKVHPMGMAIGSDGYLYIADNQNFASGKQASRVLRARLEKGAIQKIETVVSGLQVANGLRFYNGYIYITDAWTDHARKSGVYRFPISELAKQPILLNPQNRARYLVYEMQLDDATTDGVGVDGMDFDQNGDLYVGNFSDGKLIKISFDKNSQMPAITPILKQADLVGCDGIFFDKKSNSLLIANFLENSILQYSLTEKKLVMLWSNKDAACGAELDCPCDLAVIGNQLVVVNFDTYTTNANKTIDNCNTLSVFELFR